MIGELLYTALLAVFSAAAMFLLAKLMGEKQISQMSTYDYITGITVGSIAAELATNLEEPLKPLVAMVVYGLLAYFVSIITSKSIYIRRIMSGKPLVLFENGSFFRNNMKKARLDINEFLSVCRINGYFTLDDIEIALLESNGRVSIKPIPGKAPLTASDMRVETQPKHIAKILISDGRIIDENLRASGVDRKWLDKQLRTLSAPPPQDIFLALCDPSLTLSVYLAPDSPETH